MITRQDYISGKNTHEEYYSQFFNENYGRHIIYLLPKDQINVLMITKNTSDVPLKYWDKLTVPLGTSEKLKQAGDYLTLSGIVCINKLAVRKYLETLN